MPIAFTPPIATRPIALMGPKVTMPIALKMLTATRPTAIETGRRHQAYRVYSGDGDRSYGAVAP